MHWVRVIAYRNLTVIVAVHNYVPKPVSLNSPYPRNPHPPGDLSDLLPMFIDGSSDEVLSRDLSDLSPSDAWRHIMMAGHCSALIR